MRIKDIHRRLAIFLLHLLIFSGSMVASFYLRFEFHIPQSETRDLLTGLAVAVVLKFIIFRIAELHKGGWRFVSVADLERIFVTNVIASSGMAVVVLALAHGFPRSVCIVDFILTFVATAGTRFAVRVYHENHKAIGRREGAQGLLIYGFDNQGVTLLREIRSNPSFGYRVIGFLDDHADNRYARVDGVSVLGTGRDAARIVATLRNTSDQVNEIVVAMPRAGRHYMQEIVANCRAAGVPFKTLPSLPELLNGKILTKQIRDVSVVDLLGRDPVRLDERNIWESVCGRTIMVTGAAGSIGSELCRQLARFEPARIIALDQSETGLHEMQLEMLKRCPDLRFIPTVADIRDADRLTEVLEETHVDSIFHAAAYKHVPLMETHLTEALINNVIGTYNLVTAARQCNVSSFLMISSDKAVNPTNVMGMTKRLAELIASSMPVPEEGRGTKFVSVRFGNVLGSNGSVVPLFMQQIAAGGPVTVTHPEMKRYFMTIPEAVQLVLQASTMSQGSEVFVLDMGDPVRIVDLARNMIRLSGREPDTDIRIRFTGLRPGEKLFEELVLDGENMLSTYHEKIRIFRGRRPVREEMEEWIGTLKARIAARDNRRLLLHILELVPEYQPGAAWAAILSDKEKVAAIW
jgi:FlaA1/EpsC-like NDP-sugar epimerase